MRKLFIFSLVNVLISACIAINYFLVPGASITFLGSIFAFFAVLSNFFVLYLLLFLICLPLLLFNKNIRHIIVSILFGISQIVLYVDTIVFEQYRFHINQSVLSMVFSGQVVDFPIITYVLMFLLIAATLLIEYLIIYFIDKRITVRQQNASKNNKQKSRLVMLSSVFFIFALLVSNIGNMVAFYYAYTPIMVVKEYVPLYYPLTSKKIMGMIDKDGQKQNAYINNDDHKTSISYPLHDLVINPNNQKTYDIIFIVLDSWRFDTFNQEITPNTYRFVQEQNGIIFNHHYSTGNATRTGIFGLFYGIPGTYWKTFLHNSTPSLFVTTLQEEDYDIGIFSAAKISSPEFDRTAFVTIENLRITSEGKTSPDRDRVLTEDWSEWYKSRDTNCSSFSFLFYDSAHAYDFPKNSDVKFKPMGDLNYMTLDNNTDPTLIFNRYKQSVYYIDSLLEDVYKQLVESGRLDNSLIIITGDHSQEMNDNQLGFWGHNGNYTDAQTKVPFIVIGAKDTEHLLENRNKLTSHEDVVPTLMKNYLHVKNDIRDYSTGYDLFSPILDREWLLMSNYSSYAIRTLESIYMVNSVGISHYMDSHNRELDETPNYKYISDAMDDMKHFIDTGRKNVSVNR